MNRRDFIKSLSFIPAISVISLPFFIPVETETEKLARWYDTLNDWEWPDDMPGKPENFDTWQYKDIHYYIAPIMLGIKKIIGEKETLRWHWLHNLKKSNAEFEEWYELEGKYPFFGR